MDTFVQTLLKYHINHLCEQLYQKWSVTKYMFKKLRNLSYSQHVGDYHI